MADENLGSDIKVAGDLVVDADGGLVLLTGRRALAQDLMLRLSTPVGDLAGHPAFGIDIYPCYHQDGTEINRLDLAGLIEAAVEEDPRVVLGSARATVREWSKGKISLDLSVEPIDGSSPLNFVLGYGIDQITVEVVS